MACCVTVDSERRQSQQIDKEIVQWMKNYQKTIKLLLLGAGESGKSTILKQMKILQLQGFSESERKEKALDIKQNVLEAIKELTSNMGELSPPESLTDEEGLKSLEFVNLINSSEPYHFPQEFYDHVIHLWSDPGIQKTFMRRNEFSLIDSAKYFLDKVHHIRQVHYIPTDQDILYCRKKTSSIQRIEMNIKVPKKYGGGLQTLWMFDVGGQRGERRKWIQVFEGITAVLFLVSSSAFDLRLREDPLINRLEESLTLFRDCWNSRFLRDSGFILFFNKQDQLKEKIEKGATIEDFYPAYKKYTPKDLVRNEYEKTRCFIRDLFLDMTKKQTIRASYPVDYHGSLKGNKNRDCFWHFTTATDTKNIGRVFEDIHTTVILLNLHSIAPL